MTRPIAAWLRETRLRQTMPNGDPWTQDYLIEQMQAAIEWAPHRPNYSKYENPEPPPKGSTPDRDTLAKFIKFWAGKGQPGPDLTPPTEPATEPTLASVLMALATELRASREDREQMEFRLRAVEAELESLRGRPAGGGSPERSSLRGSTG